MENSRIDALKQAIEDVDQLKVPVGFRRRSGQKLLDAFVGLGWEVALPTQEYLRKATIIVPHNMVKMQFDKPTVLPIPDSGKNTQALVNEMLRQMKGGPWSPLPAVLAVENQSSPDFTRLAHFTVLPEQHVPVLDFVSLRELFLRKGHIAGFIFTGFIG